MSQSLLPLATLAASFLTLFGSAEWMHRRQFLQTEWSRKYVHIFTGLITLLFPLMLDNHWQVLFLCGSFAVILVASKRLGMLQSINGISRPSYGSILYPVAVYGAFLMFEWKGGNYLWFYGPILMMALCDPVAAWVGKRHPWKPYRVAREVKTLSGSLAFFGTGWGLMLVLLTLFPAQWVFPIPVVALILALTSALVEGLSQRGTDNLWIPMNVMLVMEALHLSEML